MELREYVRACRRRWAWLVVPVLIAAALAAGLSLSSPPAYRSSMVLFITTGTGDPDARASRLNSYIALLTGPRVAASVVAKVGPPMTAERVQQSLSAQVQDGTDLLVVSAVDPDPGRSRQIVTAATSSLVTLAKQLDPPSAAPADGPKPSVTVAQDPVTAREPSDLVRDLGFSAVLGLLVGAVAVAVREATRKTVADEDDLRRLGLGTVGVIAIGRSAGPPGEALAEGFRRLRSLLPNIAARQEDGRRGTSLMLTGSHPKEGTTAVACGLAIAMAETGAKVVLVDANLRSPGVGRYLALDNGRGFTDVLSGYASVREVLQDSLDGRLTVLPSGHPAADPGELLASPRLGAAVSALTETFDVVLVDAPPLQAVADPVVLSKVTDSALLVVRANRTPATDVERSRDLLERVGATLAGAVLNALPRKLPTGTGWHHRPRAVPPPGDPGLVSGAPRQDYPAVVDTVVIPAQTDPVRGRARVVKSTLVRSSTARPPEPAEPQETQPAEPEKPRGQAKVISADAEPPILPVQRDGADHEKTRDDE